MRGGLSTIDAHITPTPDTQVAPSTSQMDQSTIDLRIHICPLHAPNSDIQFNGMSVAGMRVRLVGFEIAVHDLEVGVSPPQSSIHAKFLQVLHYNLLKTTFGLDPKQYSTQVFSHGSCAARISTIELLRSLIRVETPRLTRTSRRSLIPKPRHPTISCASLSQAASLSRFHPLHHQIKRPFRRLREQRLSKYHQSLQILDQMRMKAQPSHRLWRTGVTLQDQLHCCNVLSLRIQETPLTTA